MNDFCSVGLAIGSSVDGQQFEEIRNGEMRKERLDVEMLAVLLGGLHTFDGCYEAVKDSKSLPCTDILTKFCVRVW